ncbi:Fatty acid hydroxylase domain-containing 2-like protein [Cladobotryum mycophilum]|uniref:Fatty acid hydroxylase domain-containing 2-like protein n=1 Tax=Cladobotryum mycophilum TaxID=491253 RepID=A0ABR0SSY6_9HYPO
MSVTSAIPALWEHIATTYHPAVIEAFSAVIFQFVFWWIPSTIYVSLDYIAPSFSARHKIQPAPKQPTFKEIQQCLLVAVRNSLTTTAFQTSILYMMYRADASPAHKFDPEIPPSPTLCETLSSVHHQFTAPVAYASQYAHPVEHILANVLPIGLPSVVLHTHILTSLVFAAWQLFQTSTVHSGYDFFAGMARQHDRHHERFDVYFGHGIIDWLHGTDEKDFKKTKKKD